VSLNPPPSHAANASASGGRTPVAKRVSGRPLAARQLVLGFAAAISAYAAGGEPADVAEHVFELHLRDWEQLDRKPLAGEEATRTTDSL
jgi:hypothetical protein